MHIIDCIYMEYGHDTHREKSIQRRHNRRLDAYKRHADHLVQEIHNGGFDEALKYVPNIVDKTKFLLVHATNFFPSHNMIKTGHVVSLLGVKKIDPTRETLHFTLNNMVTSHYAGNWDECKCAILFPYDHVKSRVHLSPLFDTTVVGNVILPPGTTLIVKKQRVLPQKFLKTITCWGEKIKVDKHVREMGMLARGLCLYEEHYHEQFRMRDTRLQEFCRNNCAKYTPEAYVQGVLNISVSLQGDIRSFYEDGTKSLNYDALKEFADKFSSLTFEHIRRDYSGPWIQPKVNTKHHIIYTTKPVFDAVREELILRNVPLVTHYTNDSVFENDHDNLERFKSALSFRSPHVNPFMKMVYDTAQDVLSQELDSDRMTKIFFAYLNNANKFHHQKMHAFSWYGANTDNNLLDELLLEDILKTEYIEGDDIKYWIKHPEEIKAIKRWLRHSKMQRRLKIMLHAIKNRDVNEQLVDILLHCPDRGTAKKRIESLGLPVEPLLNECVRIQTEIRKIVLDYEKVHGQKVLEQLDKEEKWLAREYTEVHKNHKVHGRGIRRIWGLHNQVMNQFSEDMDPSIKTLYDIAHKQFLNLFKDYKDGRITDEELGKQINVQLSIIKLLREWIKEHVILSKELKEYS